MSKRPFVTLSLMISLGILTACAKSTSSREPIKKGSKGSSKSQKTGDFGSCQLTPNGCLDLIELKKCLESKTDSLSRYYTSDLKIVKPSALPDLSPNAASSKPAPSDRVAQEQEFDARLPLAQIVNDSKDVKIEYRAGLLSEVIKNTPLNQVISQNECKSVQLQGTDGQIKEMKIIYSFKGATAITLQSNEKKETLHVQLAKDQNRIRFFQSVDGDKPLIKCDFNHAVRLKIETQLSFGSHLKSPLTVGRSLIELAADYTDSNSSVKSLNKTDPNLGTLNPGLRSKTILNEKIQIEEIVYQSLVPALQSGKLKNLDCKAQP